MLCKAGSVGVGPRGGLTAGPAPQPLGQLRLWSGFGAALWVYEAFVPVPTHPSPGIPPAAGARSKHSSALSRVCLKFLNHVPMGLLAKSWDQRCISFINRKIEQIHSFFFLTPSCSLQGLARTSFSCPRSAATPHYPLTSTGCFLHREPPYLPVPARFSALCPGKQAFPGLTQLCVLGGPAETCRDLSQVPQHHSPELYVVSPQARGSVLPGPRAGPGTQPPAVLMG